MRGHELIKKITGGEIKEGTEIIWVNNYDFLTGDIIVEAANKLNKEDK